MIARLPRPRLAMLLTAALVALAGCGDGADDTVVVERSTTSAPPPSTVTSPATPTASTAAPAPSIPVIGQGDARQDQRADPADEPSRPEYSERTAPTSNMMLALAERRFADLLAAVVDDDGLVRYDLLEKQRWADVLKKVVTAYAKTRLPETRAQRLALWCNAYNANVLALVLEERRRGTVVSVDDVSGFFDDRPITVADETLTLNQLENDRIRPLGDPRAHAALVCAAMSCPPLRGEPYRAATIEEQLDDQSRRWVGDASKNRAAGGALELSRIFEWYGEDFAIETYGGPAGFVRAFAEPGSEVARASQAAGVETVYLPYDWALNQAPIRETPEK